MLTRPLAVKPPIACETVHEAVLRLTPFRREDYQAGLRPREELAAKVRLIISEATGVPFAEIHQIHRPDGLLTMALDSVLPEEYAHVRRVFEDGYTIVPGVFAAADVTAMGDALAQAMMTPGGGRDRARGSGLRRTQPHPMVASRV